MKLLDIPLELVRSIIETTVQDLGLRSSARLREVCKTFDNEVMRSYETLRIFAHSENTTFDCRDVESNWRGNWGRSIIPFLARFIERRPNEANWEPTQAEDDLELWQTSLPCLLNRILDDLNIDAEDRFEALVCLLESRDDFDRTSPELNLPGIILDLEFGSFCPKSEQVHDFDEALLEKLSEHVLTAAILLKKHATYRHLLGKAYAPRAELIRAIGGTPVWAAIRSRQYDLAISQISFSLIGPHMIWGDPISAIVETGDLDMARQLFQLAWTERAATKDRLEMAIMRCAQLGDSKMCQLLIETAIENGADSSDFGDGFRDALFRSTLFGDLPFIKLLYFHKGSLDLLNLLNPTNHYSIYPIGVAAWAGRTEVLQWFIDQENDLMSHHIVTSFCAAIHGDKVESLRCLIEGLLDNELPTIDLNNGYWNSVQITDGLCLKSYRSVQYLLEKAPVMAHPEYYGEVVSETVMGGHIEVLETFIRLGFPMDKPLWTPNDLAWTPIMYAHASAEPGARQIEQRLYQLRIEPVDMTKAQYRDDFEMQRNQPVATYTSSMPLSLELEKTYKQKPAENVVYINGPRQANRGHDTHQ